MSLFPRNLDTFGVQKGLICEGKRKLTFLTEIWTKLRL